MGPGTGLLMDAGVLVCGGMCCFTDALDGEEAEEDEEEEEEGRGRWCGEAGEALGFIFSIMVLESSEETLSVLSRRSSVLASVSRPCPVFIQV